MHPIQAASEPVPITPPFRRFKKYLLSLGRSATCYLLLGASAYTVYNYAAVFNQGVCSIPLICGHRTQEFQIRFEDLVEIQRNFEPLLDIAGYEIQMAADVRNSQGALEGLSIRVRI
jgi:hypothetical protein